MTQKNELQEAEQRLSQMNETVLKCTLAALRRLKELDDSFVVGQEDPAAKDNQKKP